MKNKKILKKDILSLDIINCKTSKIKAKPIKKFSYEEFRRKKYVRHSPYCWDNYKNYEENDKDSILTNKYLDTFMYSRNKNKELKEIIPNYFLTYGHNSKIECTFSNNLLKKHSLSNRMESKKILFRRKLKENNLSRILNKKNIIELIKSKDKPIFFISTDMNNNNNKNFQSLNIYEKNRYEKNMEIFLDFKKQIEDNHNERFDIAKNFLIKNGITESKYLSFEKLKILISYINEKLELDATKTLKQNIVNILQGEK